MHYLTGGAWHFKMSVAEIARVLALEQIDTYIFRGYSPKSTYNPRVYGGQLLAQSLLAASRTVESDLAIHSLHSYFLLPGDLTIPIIYNVTPIRDGASFATRSVSAIQSGKPIFSLTCSFQRLRPGEDFYSHQDPMPVNIPKPEDVPNDNERFKQAVDTESFPDRLKSFYRKRLEAPLLLDIHRIDPVNPIRPKDNLSSQDLLWVKTHGSLPVDDPKFHQCVAAYASDIGMVGTMLRPHGPGYKELSAVASIDHSMWFHAPFRADEYLLMEIHSPRTSNSRGLAIGRMFDLKGRLVVTFAQEGLIRKSSL